MPEPAHRVCSSCGAKREPDIEFCPACGKKRSRLVKPPTAGQLKRARWEKHKTTIDGLTERLAWIASRAVEYAGYNLENIGDDLYSSMETYDQAQRARKAYATALAEWPRGESLLIASEALAIATQVKHFQQAAELSTHPGMINQVGDCAVESYKVMKMVTPSHQACIDQQATGDLGIAYQIIAKLPVQQRNEERRSYAEKLIKPFLTTGSLPRVPIPAVPVRQGDFLLSVDVLSDDGGSSFPSATSQRAPRQKEKAAPANTTCACLFIVALIFIFMRCAFAMQTVIVELR